MSANAVRFEVILFDSVGVPYTGSTPEHSGLGGSEFETILLAEALARRGYGVLVLNRTLVPALERGVQYVNCAVANVRSFECKVLVVARYSVVPPIAHDRLVVVASDIPDKAYDHFGPYFTGATGTKPATLVALSAWQRSLFPAGWNSMVIPYMLPERVYSTEAKADPRRFVYASAALKGLRETLEAWEGLKRDPAFADARLAVCTPGYEKPAEEPLVGEGVSFIGSLPFDAVVREIASSAGLFYVNTFPETFGIVPALAEALGRRVHILCANHVGGLRETVRSPLLTTSRDDFTASFRAAYDSPDPSRWLAEPVDYHESTVMERWLRTLRLDRGSQSVAGDQVRTPTLCLNMIVKDEAHVIERCLASVKGIVSHWVIVDTGSSDGTQDVIRRCMEGVPGELHERPWKDFAHNRTEAIELARGKGDYLLVMDADDWLEVGPDFSADSLVEDAYEVRFDDHGTTYYRVQIFRSDLGFHYVGVLHEILMPAPKRSRAANLVYHRVGGGARSRDPDKMRRDIAVLEEGIRAEPNNDRYVYYLARTLSDAGENEKALAAFERRVAMGGWDQEIWASYVAIGLILDRLGRDEAVITAALLRAYEYRPRRAEPLCYLASYCRAKQRFAMAYLYASVAVHTPRPVEDSIWLDQAVYQWRALDEYAIAAYYVGRHAEAVDANKRLLASPHLPESERARVQKNMEFSTAIVGVR